MLSRIRATASAARETGALLSIETELRLIRTPQTPFLVRKVANLKRKDEAAAARAADAVAPTKRKREANFNPFLPYEKAMFVENIGPSHVCLLNKFNVVDDHILVVTSAFEPQGSLLCAGDFRAVWHCLSQLDGLAFYNAGRIAGASQRHKHAQVVPTPLVAGLGDSVRTPFDRILSQSESENDQCADASGRPYSSPHLPFLHGLVRLDSCRNMGEDAAASFLVDRYNALLTLLGVELGIAQNAGTPASEDTREGPTSAPVDDGTGLDVCQPFPYNLLMTRDWMLIVPRRKEFYEGAFEGKISVNALGFCGSLFVRDDEQLRVVEREPMQVLADVAFPRRTEQR